MRGLRTRPAARKSSSMDCRFDSICGVGEGERRFTSLIVAGRPFGSLEERMGPPSGGPAREAFYWREVLKGSREGGPKQTLERVVTFLGRAKFGEASANYLVRCGKVRNVAPGRKNYSGMRDFCGNPRLRCHFRQKIGQFLAEKTRHLRSIPCSKPLNASDYWFGVLGAPPGASSCFTSGPSPGRGQFLSRSNSFSR